MTAVSTNFRSLAGDMPLPVPREVVCHCLQVTRDEIEATIEMGAARSVKCVIRETGAGGGCTACHCTIRNMLEAAGHTVVCRTPRLVELNSEPPAVAG